MCARDVNECARELREHDEGNPKRGHANTLRSNIAAQLHSENAEALRARERHGSDAPYGCLNARERMGEGGALPQLTQGHGVVEGDELAATRWCSEFLARF